MLQAIRAQRNINKLLHITEEYIDKYEDESSIICPSCKKDIIQRFSKVLTSSKSEAATWTDATDYERIAHVWLSQISFNLLASGNYHIYYGELNPLSCARKLLAVYHSAMAWGVSHGIITDADLKNQVDYLWECIHSVG